VLVCLTFVSFEVPSNAGCLEFSDSQALQKYYDLLFDIMRVVVTCVLSRGPQNRQAIDAGRSFLMENRNTVVTVFKRHAGIGGNGWDGIGNLKALVDLFVLLISLTGFIEVCSFQRFCWDHQLMIASFPDRERKF
jgi:hypothetical protein